jgi:isopenicillin N synthase-like dioxygenase
VEIPVIDIHRQDAATLRQLDAACREWGFFQITNHGISEDLIASTHRAMREFFALPLDAKRAIERTATNSWGFYDRELTKNKQDLKQIFDVGPDESDGPLAGQVAQWPAELPAFRTTMMAFYEECTRISFLLLSEISRALDMPPDHLHGAFKPRHSSFLRLNYYPRCDDPAPADTPLGAAGNFGINHHTDAGAITVLLQDDIPGLQVFRDNTWTLVEPRRDALVINIGDIVQVWSNDRYRAALHRVIASSATSAERYSAPFFFNPASEATYAPLSTSEPAHYRPIQWGEFRANRSAGDYADHGEEVQISHYKISAPTT